MVALAGRAERTDATIHRRESSRRNVSTSNATSGGGCRRPGPHTVDQRRQPVGHGGRARPTAGSRTMTMDATRQRFLMCRPTYFAVDYAINPWMDPTAPVDADLADPAVGARCAAAYLEPRPLRRPDRPGRRPARHGLRRQRRARSIDGEALGAQFRDPQRAAEAPAYRAWFERRRLRGARRRSTSTRARATCCCVGDHLLAGTGFRTDARRARARLQELFGRPVVTLQLVDPRFYHLDTALRRAGRADNVAYFPEAFSPGSQAVLRRLFPDAVARHQADAERARAQRGQRRPARGAARAGHRPGREAARARLRADPGRPVRAAQGRRRTEVLHAGDPSGNGKQWIEDLLRTPGAVARRGALDGAQLPPAAGGHRRAPRAPG